LLLALSAAALLAGCGVSVPSAGRGRLLAVGAENEYANVIAQVGGRYVTTRAIESNPNTDPHDFEASPSVAATVAAARLVVQNGLGYDTFMNRIEAANPAPRRVIDVQRLLGLPDSTPNPHLWYSPSTMPALAGAVARALGALEPAHAAYFAAAARRFDASLTPWRRLLARLSEIRPHPAAAVTEPVGDYLLQAAGVRIRTPFQFQADVMNGIDPAPQQVSLEHDLLAGHRVQVFLYNQQVTDSLTESFLASARASEIPVVGVYETMPPGFDYQRWMLAETRALQRALVRGSSTERL
jgi:zinc/manganese transport system substrate-binding protein